VSDLRCWEGEGPDDEEFVCPECCPGWDDHDAAVPPRAQDDDVEDRTHWWADHDPANVVILAWALGVLITALLALLYKYTGLL
jgi:hypothetical protein